MNDAVNKGDEKMYFYERFAADFDSKVNMYDTVRRVDVFFNDLLKNENLEGKSLLDAGCGTGWFSAEAARRGAKVTSMDLGPGLLAQVEKKCNSERVVGSILEMPFDNNTFDYVVSSEVIEHTPDKAKAIQEIYRVLKPNGIAVVSTPNSFWYFSLVIAQALKLRPYQGLENWSWWSELSYIFKLKGFKVIDQTGIHMFPFVINALNVILKPLDKLGRIFGFMMVNIAIKAKK